MTEKKTFDEPRRAGLILSAALLAAMCCTPLLAKTCEKCRGVGFTTDFCGCRHCNGEGTVDPARLGRYSSVRRWNVSSQYHNGLKVGEWRTERPVKHYTKQPCPACKGSAKIGKVRQKMICRECGGMGVQAPFGQFDADKFNKAAKYASEAYSKEIATIEKEYKHDEAAFGDLESNRKMLDEGKKFIEFTKSNRDKLAKVSAADADGLADIAAKGEYRALLDEYMKLTRFNYDCGISKKHNLNTYEKDEAGRQ